MSNALYAYQYKKKLENNVIDFTHHKLLSLIKYYTYFSKGGERDMHKLLALMSLQKKYVQNKVAITWCNGEPKYVQICD